ncbi:YadA-like family protein [Pasteurella testudinis]|uniref:YadA-like family protein n=1 Tax=Pasteurella testudinis TaxID=761 RepID=UPI0040590A37
MNKVYKVIWNKVTQAFVVVSELATARGKAASESNGDVIECAVNRELFSHFIFSLKVSVVAVTVALFGSNAFAYQVNGSGAPTTDPNNVTNVVIGGGSGANQATKVVNGGDRSTIIGAGAKGIAADDWRAEGATAIGAGAQATGGATALGWNAKVSNTTGGVAVGSDTRVSGANAIAMGWAAQSSASDAIAIGTQAVAALSQSTNTNQGGNISIGAHAYSSNFGPSSQIIADRTDGGELSFRNTNGQMVTNMLPSAVSIGEYSKAYAGGTAVGYNNIAGIEGQEGAMAFAFGNNNNATGFYSTALGAANKATGPSAITLGVANSADGNTAVAIGRQVTASGQYSTALGNIATASGDNAFAVGHSSQATGNRAIAIGSSTATDSNLALATATQATSTDAIAVGTNTKASGDYSLALGRAAQATNDSSTALGNNAKAQHRNTLALGNTSTASGANSVAAGYASSATATNSVAVGSSAKAAGAASIALGNSASAGGTNAIAMGSNSTTSGVAAIAIGDASNAAVRGVSIGEKATSNASSVAIGENAKASVSVGDVAIGKNSATTAATQVSSATVNGVTYSGFAGSTPTNAFSVGSAGAERQIQNVAAGRITATSTDAINGSQLYAVAEVAGKGWNIQANGSTASKVAPGDTVDFVNGSGTTAAVTSANGTSTVSYSVNKSGLTVADNGVVSAQTAGDNFATAGDVAKAINSANKTTVVAAGNNVTVNDPVVNGTVTTYTVNADGTSVSAGSAVQVTKGEKDSTTNMTDYAVDLTDATKEDIKKGVDAATDIAQKGLTFTGDNDSTTEIKKLGDTVAVTGDENISSTASTAGIALALSKNLTVDSVKTGNTTVNNDGITIANGENPVSLTNNGLNNGGNTITNVASGGATPTNAANIGDVQTAAAAAKSEVKAGTNVVSVTSETGANKQTVYTVNAKDTTASAGSSAVTVAAGTPDTNNVTDYKVDLSDSSKESLAKADTALQSWTAQVNGAEAKVVDKDNTNVNFVNGSNIEITAEADGEIKVSTAKDVTFDRVTINNGGNIAEGSTSAVNGGDVYNAIQNSESQFTGDNGEIVKRKPADILTLKGGATESTENNIQTIANTDGSIAIQLAKSVSGLSSISTEKLTVGDKVEITEEGINAGNTVISNVASGGTTTTNAANIGDVQAAAAAAKSEVKNGTNVTSVVETKGEGGRSIYTVNADGASVSAAAESAVQVTKGEKDAETNVTDYAVDLTDATKADIKKGVEAATDIAEKGLTFTGDNDSKTDVKKLGETVAVTGDNNITTTAGTDGITLALNPNLNVTSVTAGNTTLNDAGVTIKSPTAENPANTVSLTNTGLNNGGNKITNVAAGEDATDAVNKSQLDALKDTITAGEKSTVVEQGNNTTVTSAVDGNVTTYTVNAEKTTVSQGNGITVTAGETDESGVTDYEVALDNNITIGNDTDAGTLTVKGENGKDGISLNGADGTIGLNGKDGASATIGVKAGQPGLNGADGTTQPRLTVGDDEVATLNDGLKFEGNEGGEISRTLNSKLDIKGAATGEATAENIKTVGTQDGGLLIQLAKDLVDLTSIATDTITVGDTVTISKDGIDAGNKPISNVADGVNGKDAVNKDQLDALAKNIADSEKSAVVAAGKNVTVDNSSSEDGKVTTYTVNAEKTTVSQGNGITVTAGETDESGVTDYEVALDNNITIGNDTDAGTLTVKGENGKDGISLNGADGTIGLNGKDGASATIGVKAGQPSLNGADGTTQPRLTVGDEEVATLNDGLNFVGDNADVKVARKLNDTLAITGGATGETTDNNIKTVGNADGSIAIQLAKNLVELTSVATESLTVGDTVTISKDGIDAGNKPISNVADGVNGKDAVNKDQLDALAKNIADSEKSAVVAAGKNVTVDNSSSEDGKVTTYTVNAEKTTVSQGNGITVTAGETDENGVTDYKVALDNDITIGSNDEAGTLTVKGENGKDGISLNGADGTIGLNGKDGASATIGVKAGQPGLNGADGTTQPRLTVGDDEVATLNDGLNFAGNQGDVIAKKLNDTLTVKGGLANDSEASAANLRVDSESGELVVKLAKELTNLTSATFTNTAGTQTVVNGGGVTITPTAGSGKAPVSLTETGLNNGGNQITNVASGGDVDTNAANIGDVKKAVNATKVEVEAGKNVQVNSRAGTDGHTIYTVATTNDLDVNSVTAGDTKVNTNGVTVGDEVNLTKDGLTVGDVSITTGGINAGGNKITGVAAGDISANSTDAVNGSQLYAIQQQAGAHSSVVAGDNVVVTTGTNDKGGVEYKVATAKEVAFDKTTVGSVVTDSGSNKITGLANGDVSASSSDAVNGSQLYNNAKSVADALGGDSSVDANGNVTAPTYTITKTDGSTVTTNSVGGALNYFNREVVKPITFAADDGSHDAQLGTTVHVKGDGKNISTAVKGNTLTISMTDTPEFSSVTTGNTTMSSQGIVVKGGENGDVSLTANGLNNGGNRITNVADGVENNDAATVGQVKSMGNALNNRISEVDSKARAGIAGALATAGLYQAYLPGHSMVAVGAGTYRGENALAIGVSRISDNGKIGVKLSGMSTSQGDVGGSVSVGYQW